MGAILLRGVVEGAVDALHLLFRVLKVAGDDGPGQRRVGLVGHLVDMQDLLARFQK